MVNLKDLKEFEHWLDKMLKDSKEKLNMTDELIAWELLRIGTDYYFRTIGKRT